MPRLNRFLIIILVIVFGFRLLVSLGEDHALGYSNGGGDTTWYLANGYALVAGLDETYLPDFGVDVYPEGYPIQLRNLPTPPLYLLFIGVPQVLLPREAAIVVIRIAQALLSTATLYLVYRLGRTVSADERVGLVAAGILAVSPAFILEAAQITSETLYIFLLIAALAIYAERRSQVVWVGLLLGLATLTRSALLLFPLGLAIHLLLTDGWRAGLRRGLLLLVAYTLVIGSWTAYNLIRWNRLVIGGEGLAAFVYVGATDWEGPDQVDENLLEDAGVDAIDPEEQQALYERAALNVIGDDPLGYVQRRVSELAAAYAQPHGTLLFRGESLKDLTLHWLREDRSLTGLLALAQAESFWLKLALYIYHYFALIGGIIGLWLTRNRWRWTLPLAGFILYTSLVHLALDAIPRYIFPTEAFWWIFAAATLVTLADRVCGTQHQEKGIVAGERQWL